MNEIRNTAAGPALTHPHARARRTTLVLAGLLAAMAWTAPAQAKLVIDGATDEAEWAQARVLGPFASVQPLSDAPVPDDRRVEARLLSTAEGIAVAIKAWHPRDVPRTRSRAQRDADAAVDRFNLMLDFNADGRAGYNFTVTTAGDVADETITNQNVFNYDWDGTWEAATRDFDGGYTAEYLIPWSTAVMGESAAADRTIAVYVDRVIAATGERQGFPKASFTRPRFLSDFAHVQIPQYQTSLLAITPYGVALHDLNQADSELKTGGDILWKPNGDHQFAFAINPDFGQVESDQLVVNFTTTETVFTDKRQFFTENQSYFDLQQPLGQLFYTRRVGGPSDSGSGASDIRLAAKGVGRVDRFGYGAFVATEEGEAGRDYFLGRATFGDERFLSGATVSRVERPALDRDATVFAVDANWKPTDEWLIRPLLAASRITQARGEASGTAASIVGDWDPAGPWRHQFIGMYAGDTFELNDLGYQSRNDVSQYEWETAYRVDDLPADSRFATHEYRLELIHRQNTHGLRLLGQASLYRNSTRRDGGTQDAMLRWKSPQFDDRLTRGHGPVRIGGGPQLYLDWERPRQGDGRWGMYAQLEVFPNPLGGHSLYGGVRPRFHASPTFDVDLGLFLWRQTDWLVWQHDTQLGSFFSQRAEVYSDLNWFLGERQELRVKLQAIAIDAKARQARSVLANGQVVDSDEALEDFQLRNLGFQVRYRYALAPNSDFFAVYGRGGYALEQDERELGSTLIDTFSMKEDHQLLLKFAYRFEIGG